MDSSKVELHSSKHLCSSKWILAGLLCCCELIIWFSFIFICDMYVISRQKCSEDNFANKPVHFFIHSYECNCFFDLFLEVLKMLQLRKLKLLKTSCKENFSTHHMTVSHEPNCFLCEIVWFWDVWNFGFILLQKGDAK